jgi:hypothetical protein
LAPPFVAYKQPTITGGHEYSGRRATVLLPRSGAIHTSSSTLRSRHSTMSLIDTANYLNHRSRSHCFNSSDSTSKEHATQKQSQRYRHASQNDLALIAHMASPSTTLMHAHPRSKTTLWSTMNMSEPVFDTSMKYLYSQEEKFSHVLCRRCCGYLTASLIEPPPPPWKELPPDIDAEDRTCFFNEPMDTVLWSPPPGCSDVARRVFFATGSMLTVCSCTMTWQRRRRILRKMQQFAGRYREGAHGTLVVELRQILDCHDVGQP